MLSFSFGGHTFRFSSPEEVLMFGQMVKLSGYRGKCVITGPEKYLDAFSNLFREYQKWIVEEACK